MDHDHPHHRPGARHVRPLAITFGLVLVFLVVEVIAGIATNSLALLADAGHMLTDAVGLGMALAAITAASRARPVRLHTFGLYRLEIVAAFVNAMLLVGVAVWVLIEAVQRLREPAAILGAPVLLVALGGLLVNLIGLWLLRQGAHESLNMEAAFTEVLADGMGSVAVVAAALITMTTGWPYADPLFGAGLGLFILPRAIRLGRQALHVLVQAAPSRLDLEAIRADLTAIDGVVDVHDLHVWTLTSEMEVASLHLMTDEQADPHDVLDRAEVLLRERYQLSHATLQVEPASHSTCLKTAW